MGYVSHYFFILVLSVFVIRPNKIGFQPAFFIMFFGTQLAILITYVPLNWLYELVVPPKETKALEVNQTPEEQEAARAAAAKAEAIENMGMGALDLENADMN